ncbi:uncharacterized protein LOC134831378 [Culicoides brevitarsis]|uniref:uncharacterized protein LOC134831378 n=1 Tax=Culicoides brevitarsis TaxID=469753 RepID=UPI00307CA939
MIQQDSNLLNEVKKNGGIVHKVAGHVYKIVEEDSIKNKRIRDSNDDTSSVSSRQSRKKASVRRKASMKRQQRNSRQKSVKETIQLFEPKNEKSTNVDRTSVVKPKVPDKSETVMLRSQALRLHKQTSITSAEKLTDFVMSEMTVAIESDINRVSPNSKNKETLELKDDVNSNSLGNIRHYLKHESDHKSKYSRMYEKMKCRSLITSNNKKSTQDCEEKIKDCSVSSAIDNAVRENEELNEKNTKMSEETIIPNINIEPITPDYKPNSSFLFRNATLPKNSYCSMNDIQSSLVEAINAALINKTRSMDENSFPHDESSNTNDFHSYTKNKSTLHEKNRLLSTIKVAESSTEAINEMCDEQSRVNMKDVYEYIIKSNDSEMEKTENPEDIYQSLIEVKDKRGSIDSYETVNDYEVDLNVSERSQNNTKGTTDDGYDLCDPPEPPAPRKPSIVKNDDDPLPLPVPKRIIHDNYEHVKYTDIPPRPPSKHPSSNIEKQKEQIPLPPRNGTQKVTAQESQTDISNSDEHNYYEENIYDTIKHADDQSLLSSCYEAIQQRSKTNGGDSASLLYDSVKNEFDRFGHFLQHAESTMTLASDQKTNSIYGTTLGTGQSISPPSERGSENSDDWIDISDDEGNNSQKFIIIREKQQKTNRNTEWSKKVRDQHKNLHRDSEDDFDHHYESLCSMEQAKLRLEEKLKTRPLNLLSAQDDILKNDQHQDDHDDSFDSFESDCESDAEIKKADSGVDIHNAKLPDPPQQSKQVYALMQKIKTFGSISKSEISKGFNKIRKKSMTSPKSEKSITFPAQQYENTTFYVPTDMSSANTPNTSTLVKEKPTKKKNVRRSTVSGISLKIEETQPYENHDFHSPKMAITPISSSSISSPILSHSTANASSSSNIRNGPTTDVNDFSRKKSKSGRSFKSKLRKSFATDSSLSISSSTYGNSRSTFYISDSVDVDSGIFAGNDTRTVNGSSSIITMNRQTDNNSSQSNSNEKINKLGVDDVILRDESRKSFSPDFISKRRSSTTRPNNPPPPPPAIEKDKSRGSKKLGTTSWYAECGVFKPESFNGDHRNSKRDKNTSWYAEAGLYQTSGESVISSSGSSGVSTGGEGGPGDDTLHSMFINEPLYQIYNAARLESISRDIEIVTSSDDTDGYEEVGVLKEQISDADENIKKPLRPTALQLVEPNRGSSRTLWSEVPEVLATEILLSLTNTEKYLQEAKFEILTSEASYLKSLNLLKSHFMNHPAFRDTQILSAADRKTLFSYIIPVQECSDRLLSDLESCWQDNIMLIGLSESLQKHVEKYFNVYISYCEHQGKMDRTLKRLKEVKGPFSQILETLEADPVCCGLSIHSFLMLPMQRITRLPLLIETVLSKLKSDDDEREVWTKVLAHLKKIAAQCNEAANRCEQQYLMQQISKQIEFPVNIRPLPIVPVGVTIPGTPMRTLVKKGELTHLIWRGDEAKLTFGKKFSKSSIYAFLFTDLLVLTKKKSDESYLVFDHCQRSMLTVSSGDVIPQLPTKEMSNVGKHLIIMTLLENYEGKTVEMILSCSSESERERWLQATEPPSSENPDEKLYEQWDCPQVIVKHKYKALQPDEIALEVGDVINVFRKMADGWYHGERITDGAQGWFPGNFTEEVNSAHVRARNLKERYRVLTFTANYIESQKKK